MEYQLPMKAPEVHASVMYTVCAYNYDAYVYYTMGVVLHGVPELSTCVRARL